MGAKSEVARCGQELQIRTLIVGKVNNDNMLHPCDNEVTRATEEEEGILLFMTAGDSGACADITANNVGVIGTGKQSQYSCSWVDVTAPTPMIQPHYLAIRPHHLIDPPTVGWFQIGLSSRTDIGNKHTKRGGGSGKDFGKRQKRSCARCVLHSGTNGLNCNGRKGGKGGGRNACDFFDTAGFPMDHIR